MSKNIKQINKLLENYGGSPWRFNQIMLEKFDAWRNLKYEEIFDLISISRDCIICHYSLVPFFVKYLGLDIRNIYKEVADANDWNPVYLAKVLSMFPEKFINMHEEGTLKNLGYLYLKNDLRKIRKEFMNKGAIGIDQLIIKGGHKDVILIFDEEGN